MKSATNLEKLLKPCDIRVDEICYLFDTLADNSSVNIREETGYNLTFINAVLTERFKKWYEPTRLSEEHGREDS